VEFDHIAILEKWYINLIDQYSNTPFGPTFPDAAQNLMPEIGNITNLLKYALHNHPSQDIVYGAVNISKFLSRVQPSEEILQEIFPVLGKLHMKENKPYYTWLWGDIFYKQFKYNKSREKLQDALAQYIAIGDQQGRAECLQSIGDILHMEHKYAKAREVLEDALVQYPANGDQQGRTGCLWSLGDILYIEHKYSEAREKLEDALAQFTTNGDQQGRARCLWSLGNVLYKEHKYSEAKEKLEDALVQFTANGYQRGRARCIWSLGNILHMEHKYSERETGGCIGTVHSQWIPPRKS